MFTQCPDCGTAFRVTAEVLRKAGGKVRCGGCGNAFNALAYLSESK
ncbi:MAG: MJ0042-type zinc finger domain-containing protein, partial [Woeseiaceae bacterium]